MIKRQRTFVCKFGAKTVNNCLQGNIKVTVKPVFQAISVKQNLSHETKFCYPKY